jgi:hypothetical protein
MRKDWRLLFVRFDVAEALGAELALVGYRAIARGFVERAEPLAENASVEKTFIHGASLNS